MMRRTLIYLFFFLIFLLEIPRRCCSTDCCKTVIIASNRSNEQSPKALGLFEIKPSEIFENHHVYIKHESKAHLVFSDFGWQVIPSTPEENNPPLISFTNCKAPLPSECPEKCTNNRNWKYFKDGDDIVDESLSLSIKCHDKTGVLTTNDGVEDVMSRTENKSLIRGIVIGILLTILAVVLAALVVLFQRRRKAMRKNDAESIECGSIAKTGNQKDEETKLLDKTEEPEEHKSLEHPDTLEIKQPDTSKVLQVKAPADAELSNIEDLPLNLTTIKAVTKAPSTKSTALESRPQTHSILTQTSVQDGNAKDSSLGSPKETPRTEKKESMIEIEEVSTPNRANSDEKSPDVDVSNLGELLKNIDDQVLNVFSPFGKPLNRTESQEDEQPPIKIDLDQSFDSLHSDNSDGSSVTKKKSILDIAADNRRRARELYDSFTKAIESCEQLNGEYYERVELELYEKGRPSSQIETQCSSDVYIFLPHERLAWDAITLALQGFHENKTTRFDFGSDCEIKAFSHRTTTDALTVTIPKCDIKLVSVAIFKDSGPMKETKEDAKRDNTLKESTEETVS